MVVGELDGARATFMPLPIPRIILVCLAILGFGVAIFGVPLLDVVVGCWLCWLSLPLGVAGCCITNLLLER